MAHQNIDSRQVGKIRNWHEERARALRADAEQRLKEAGEHEAKVRAYDLLAEDFASLLGSPELPFGQDDDGSSGGSEPAVAAREEGASDGSFIELVRKAVRRLPGKPDARFQKSDIESELPRVQPGIQADPRAITKALWWLAKMSKEKEIKIVRQGSGARPAIYKRLKIEEAPEGGKTPLEGG